MSGCCFAEEVMTDETTVPKLCIRLQSAGITEYYARTICLLFNGVCAFGNMANVKTAAFFSGTLATISGALAWCYDSLSTENNIKTSDYNDTQESESEPQNHQHEEETYSPIEEMSAGVNMPVMGGNGTDPLENI